MFITLRHSQQVEYYQKMLGKVGSLSGLYSESNCPLLHYRVTEKIFCRAFGADDLGRADIVVDAKLDNVGIAIKTFLQKNGSSYEKIGEFGAAKESYEKLTPLAKIKKICELRNERIRFAKRLHGLDTLAYHCVVRGEGRIMIFEQPLVEISLDNVRLKDVSGAGISFGDGRGEYSFLLSKNTLFKKFYSKQPLLTVFLKIMSEPFEFLDKQVGDEMWKGDGVEEDQVPSVAENSIILPLYSKTTEGKCVFPRSGLNQWNASGRRRSCDEVYIPIPAWIHDKWDRFFPPKDAEFSILLPDFRSLRAKVCQQGRKALMSNPNGALGKWILRDVLKIEPGELLTYSDLLKTGVDGVRLSKISNKEYTMQFSEAGEYEEFFKSHQARREEGEGEAHDCGLDKSHSECELQLD